MSPTDIRNVLSEMGADDLARDPRATDLAGALADYRAVIAQVHHKELVTAEDGRALNRAVARVDALCEALLGSCTDPAVRWHVEGALRLLVRSVEAQAVGAHV